MYHSTYELRLQETIDEWNYCLNFSSLQMIREMEVIDKRRTAELKRMEANIEWA